MGHWTGQDKTGRHGTGQKLKAEQDGTRQDSKEWELKQDGRVVGCLDRLLARAE